MSIEKVRDYLSLHPEATVTELSFRLGMSVQQARLDMESVLDGEWPVAPTAQAMVDADDAMEIIASEASHDAAWLAGLFRNREVMDVYQAAEYLGIDRGSVEYAVIRNKLTCVQVRGKKLFTRTDLDAYKAARGTGKSSRLVASAVVYEV